MKVRIIVGPNGSGKTTFYFSLLNDFQLNMGYYINADIIEDSFMKNKRYNCKELCEFIQLDELRKFVISSTLNEKYLLNDFANSLTLSNDSIYSSRTIINSYEASAIAEYLRNICLKNHINFCFESVFSDKRKIKLLKEIKKKGYRIYLYVLSTVNPSINIARVKQRTKKNGHLVPEDKILSRYSKSLENIKKSLPFAYRTFIIDNSEEFNPQIIAELNENKVVFLHKTYTPSWVLKLISK